MNTFHAQFLTSGFDVIYRAPLAVPTLPTLAVPTLPTLPAPPPMKARSAAAWSR